MQFQKNSNIKELIKEELGKIDLLPEVRFSLKVLEVKVSVQPPLTKGEALVQNPLEKRRERLSISIESQNLKIINSVTFNETWLNSAKFLLFNASTYGLLVVGNTGFILSKE